MLLFLMQFLDNLLYILSFLLIVFSFFRPVIRRISWLWLYGLLITLAASVASSLIPIYEVNYIFDFLVVWGLLALFCGEGLRCRIKYYLFTEIFLGLTNTIAMMFMGEGPSATGAASTFEEISLSMAISGISFLMVVLMAGWIVRKIPGGMEELSLGEFLQFVLVSSIDMIIILWILDLQESIAGAGILVRLLRGGAAACGIYLQLFFLFRSLVLGHVYVQKNELNERYLEAQKSHYEYLEKRETDTRRFRHDIRSHLAVLQTLLAQGKREDAEDFLGQIQEQSAGLASLIQTSNGIADAVVNRFDAEAREKGMHFAVHGQFPTECGLTSVDICTILSNLLSNAGEGAEGFGGRVSLEIRHDEQRIYIIVRNDCSPELEYSWSSLERRRLFATTKGDPMNHGLGLANVGDCVKKNNGWMQIEASQGQFQVEIALRNYLQGGQDEDRDRG